MKHEKRRPLHKDAVKAKKAQRKLTREEEQDEVLAGCDYTGVINDDCEGGGRESIGDTA